MAVWVPASVLALKQGGTMLRFFAALTFFAYAGYVRPDNYLFTSDAQRLLNVQILFAITCVIATYRIFQWVAKNYRHENDAS